MARSQFADLKSPLSKALRQVAEAGPAAVLAPVWGDVVGGGLGAQSRPVRLVDGALTVCVRPEFMAILAAEQTTLIQRLNARLGARAVRVIYFVAEG